MKKQTFVLWALTGMLAVPASAQVDYKTRAIVAEPENAPVAKRALARDAEGAEYSYPVGLRNLGMIGQDDNACCNFLSFNKVINRDAYMWAPMGETVSYIDNSSVQAVDYHWFYSPVRMPRSWKHRMPMRFTIRPVSTISRP